MKKRLTYLFVLKPDSRHTEAPMMSPAKRPKLDLDGSSGQDALMSLESALAASSNDLSFQIEQASQVNTPRSGHKLNCLLFTFFCSNLFAWKANKPLLYATDSNILYFKLSSSEWLKLFLYQDFYNSICIARWYQC